MPGCAPWATVRPKNQPPPHLTLRTHRTLYREMVVTSTVMTPLHADHGEAQAAGLVTLDVPTCWSLWLGHHSALLSLVRVSFYCSPHLGLDASSLLGSLPEFLSPMRVCLWAPTLPLLSSPNHLALWAVTWFTHQSPHQVLHLRAAGAPSTPRRPSTCPL